MYDHVLTRFSAEERARLDAAMHDACDAVRSVLAVGLDKAMSQHGSNKKAEPTAVPGAGAGAAAPGAGAGAAGAAAATGGTGASGKGASVKGGKGGKGGKAGTAWRILIATSQFATEVKIRGCKVR